MHSLLNRLCYPRIPFLGAVILVALMWSSFALCGDTHDLAKSSNDGKAFMPWELSVGGSGDPRVDTKSFTCSPVQSMRKGGKVPAMLEIGGEKSRVWSVAKHEFHIGTNRLRYPIIGVVTSQDGSGSASLAAILTMKTLVKVGTMMDSGGYRIEARRAFEAGDSMPALFIMHNNYTSVLSIDSTSDQKPSFAAFKDRMKPNDCAAAIETWRIVNEYVAQGNATR